MLWSKRSPADNMPDNRLANDSPPIQIMQTPTSKISSDVSSLERGICPSSRAFSSRWGVGASVLSSSLSSATAYACCHYVASIMPEHAAVNRRNSPHNALFLSCLSASGFSLPVRRLIFGIREVGSHFIDIKYNEHLYKPVLRRLISPSDIKIKKPLKYINWFSFLQFIFSPEKKYFITIFMHRKQATLTV